MLMAIRAESADHGAITMNLAITMGDANGVGGEILLRCFALGQLPADAVVFGEAAILSVGARILELDVDIHAMKDRHDFNRNALNVISLGALNADDLRPGTLDPKCGAAAFNAVQAAVRDVMNGRSRALVTLPVNKRATSMSVPSFTGHTELIADMCDTPDVAMMLATEDVAVSHVSTHVSLRQAIEWVTEKRVFATIKRLHAALDCLHPDPRIAVCGLNPHAGEDGMFGNEEKHHIKPAIRAAVSAGMDVTGPCSADTVFTQAIRLHRFDGVVCMYHDQGHAPMKLWAFETGVNVTLGLPIVRTSVDHGTAFDIAWMGEASTASLPAAIEYAEKLVTAGYASGKLVA